MKSSSDRPRWVNLVRERLPRPLLADEPSERFEEIVEELSHHLEDTFDDALARGLDDERALQAALAEIPDWDELSRRIASASRARPSTNSEPRHGFGSGLFKDLRHGVRLLVQKPGFTLAAGLALALGIGANTVAFTFVRAMLFHELPVAAPERLIRVYGRLAEFPYAAVSYPDVEEIRERATLLEDILAEKLVPMNLGTEQGNERIWGYVVSENYFRVLGVEPFLGRFFEPGKHSVVVLSHGFWQRFFAGARDVVGTTIRLNGHPFAVIGVTPAEFTGTNVGLLPLLFAPASMSEQVLPGVDILERRNRSFLSLARLAPGVEVEEARAELDAIARSLAADHPDSNRGFGFNLLKESEGGIHPIMKGGFIGFSAVLVFVVVLVLLLACANVAGLLLSRGFYRRKELSLRLALGATRARLLRQLLVESLLLSLVGGLAGLALAAAALRFLTTLRPPTDVPLYLPLALDLRVLVFSALATLLTGVLFGLAPGLQVAKIDLVSALKTTMGALPRGQSRFRSALVSGQIALSTLLLVGTGLFLRSLSNARSIDLGFEPAGVTMAAIDLGLQGYDDERGRRFYAHVEERLEALPGVESVGFVHIVPFDLNINQHELAPEGFEPAPDEGFPSIDVNVVSQDYFATMKTPIIDGRSFTLLDDADAPPVVIVNETLARRFWPNQRALGKRVRRPSGATLEVVGVVRDGKYLSLGEDPKPFLFYSLPQRGTLDMTVVVRTAGDPHPLLGLIREEVQALDRDVPLYKVKTLAEHMQIALAPARAGAAIVGSFGVLALALASLGLYGVVAFWVAQQNFAIGIRRALGAGSSHIFWEVLARGMKLALPGLVLGLLASAAVSRFTASVLYGIRPVDPLAYTVASLVLMVTVLLACIVPARRATTVDPVVALRSE